MSIWDCLFSDDRDSLDSNKFYRLKTITINKDLQLREDFNRWEYETQVSKETIYS